MVARQGVLDLRKASIADLDGGKLDLHGRLDLHGEGDHGRIEAVLDAPRAEGVLALLDELPLPERVVAAPHARAGALAPAKLSASLGSATDGAGDRKSTRLNSKSLMSNSYAVFCLKKNKT